MGDRSSWLVLKIPLTCDTISDVLSKTTKLTSPTKHQSCKESTTTQWKPTISIKPENNPVTCTTVHPQPTNDKSREVAPRDQR